MDTVPGLKKLKARKQELLLESELNRQVWRIEAGRLRLKIERLQRGYDWAHHAWAWAAPVAGFLLARKFKKTAGVFTGGSLLLNALKSAWKFWTERQKPSPGDGANN